jgi:hypothetical protein
VDFFLAFLSNLKLDFVFLDFLAVLWSRNWSRKEPELLTKAGAGAAMSKFRLRLPAPGQLK